MTEVTRDDIIAGLEAAGFELRPHVKPPDLVKLASELAQMLWDAEGGDIDNESVQGLLVSCGVVRYRKPTEAELKDPEWWGHEWEIGPDDEGVGEYTHDMKELRKAAKAAESA